MLKFFSPLVTALVSLLVLCAGRGADLPKPAALGEAGKLLAEYKFEASESSKAFSRPLSVSLAEDLIVITELGTPTALPKPKALPVQLLRLKLTPKIEVTQGPSLDAPPDYRGNMFRCSAFSPDGKIVAVSSQLVKSAKWDDNWAVIDFYRTGDGVRYKSLHREKGPDFVTGLRFSPNGKSLAVGYSVHNAGRQGSFGLWDLGTDTFRPFGRVTPTDICFNDAGTHIATSESYNGIVQVWDVESGKELAKDDPIRDAPVGAMGAARSMRFSQDSKTLFSASVESRPGLRTREYNLAERKKVAAWEMPKKEEAGAKREMQECFLSLDGALMLTSEELRRDLRGEECDLTINCELIDLKSRRSLVKIETYSGRVKTAPEREGGFSASASVQTMYLSRDARFIVTLGGPRDGSDTRLKVWATGLSVSIAPAAAGKDPDRAAPEPEAVKRFKELGYYLHKQNDSGDVAVSFGGGGLLTKPHSAEAVSLLPQIPNFISLNFYEGNLTLADLQSIAAVPRLKSLAFYKGTLPDDATKALSASASIERLMFDSELTAKPFGDADLAHLARIKTLKSLELRFPVAPTAKGLKAFAESTKLQELWIANAEFDDECLKALAPLASSLRSLALNSRKVTPDGWRALGQFTKIESLWLVDSSIDGRSMGGIGKLTELRSLVLARSDVSDEGTKALAGLKKLKTLLLDETKVTDEGLKHLENLTSLVELQVGNSAITAKGIMHLGKNQGMGMLLGRGSKIADADADMPKLEKLFPNSEIVSGNGLFNGTTKKEPGNEGSPTPKEKPTPKEQKPQRVGPESSKATDASAADIRLVSSLQTGSSVRKVNSGQGGAGTLRADEGGTWRMPNTPQAFAQPRCGEAHPQFL